MEEDKFLIILRDIDRLDNTYDMLQSTIKKPSNHAHADNKEFKEHLHKMRQMILTQAMRENINSEELKQTV